MWEIPLVIKITSWLASAAGWAGAASEGGGIAATAGLWLRRARTAVTGSTGGALAIVIATLVALFGYTWFVMHVQYGWDTNAVQNALASKNKELGDVNTVEAARVAGNDATRAGQVITVFRTIEVEKPVPGPTQVVTVTQPGPPVPYAVPGNCPVNEVHRLADTPADLRRQLNAIK